MRVVARSLAAALTLHAPFAHAQSRVGELPAAPSQPSPRCALHARPLVPDAPGVVPDARVAPAVVATGTATLIAYRSTQDTVYLARLARETFVRVGADRELAHPAGPFALTASPGGAAAVLVESGARGEAAVLLARWSPTGEARNVPRELGRAATVDGVAIAWTGLGYLVAWGAHGIAGAPATASGTWVVATDARGVPRVPARRLLDATQPRLAYLPGLDLVVLSANGGTGAEPTIVSLDADGTTSGSGRWSSQARGLVPGGAGASALALAVSPGSVDPTLATPGTGLWLARWSLDASPTEASLGFRVAPDAQIVAMAPDRAGPVAAIDEPSGRELIVRVATDGTVVPLVSRPGSLGALYFGADGAITVIGHEPPPAGHGRLAIVQIACPRLASPPPAPPVSVPETPRDASTPDDADR